MSAHTLVTLTSHPAFRRGRAVAACTLFTLLGLYAYNRSAPQRMEYALRNASLQELQGESLRQPTNPRVLYYLGVRAQEAQNLPLANDAYRRAYALDDRDEKSLLYAAYTCDLLGDRGQALRMLMDGVQKYPKNVRSQFALAKLYHNINLPGNALVHIEPVVLAQPKNHKAWYLYGLTLRWAQRQTQARDAFQRAVSLDPENGDYLFNLAESQSHLHQLPEAEANYRRALSLSPQSPKANALLAGFLYEKVPTDAGKNEAETLLKKVLAAEPQNSFSLYMLGRISLDRHEAQRAANYLKAALVQNPDKTVGWYALSTAYHELGQTKLAEEARTTSIRLRDEAERTQKMIDVAEANPKNFALHLQLARYYTTRADSMTAALNQYFLCHQLDPGDKKLVAELNAYETHLQEQGKLPSLDFLNALADTTARDSAAYRPAK